MSPRSFLRQVEELNDRAFHERSIVHFGDEDELTESISNGDSNPFQCDHFSKILNELTHPFCTLFSSVFVRQLKNRSTV